MFTPHTRSALLILKCYAAGYGHTGDGARCPSIKHAGYWVLVAALLVPSATKGVADMVLADDNFATIISACEEGRRIYANIRKPVPPEPNLCRGYFRLYCIPSGFTDPQPTHLLQWINLIIDSLACACYGYRDS